jgi:D-alanine-D-alanine ligase
MEHVMDRLGHRVVVKPTRGGSALGVTGVDGLSELPSALVGTYAYYPEALIERFYPGANVSVVVRETANGLEPLVPIEIDFVKGHEFDFSARYTAEYVGLRQLDLPTEAIAAIGDAAVAVHELLGLRDLSRTDLIVDPDGSFVVLEAAITPGATETSVMPFACTESGTSLGELSVALVERALARA